MQPEITLVHGTFQPKAKWTMEENSPLCSFLREKLGNDVKFHRFAWSGKNSNAARRAAAAQLGSDLRTRLDQPGAAPQLVIGHSHGGSILAYAVHSDPELQARLAGIVFLSTPFIRVARRPLGPALLLPILLAALFLFFEAVKWWGPVLRRFTADWHWFLEQTVHLVSAIGLIVVTIFFISELLVRLAPHKGLPVWLEKRVAVVIDSFACDRLPADRTLIVRSSGDEASSGLAVLQIASRLLGDFSAWLARSVAIPIIFLRRISAAVPAESAPKTPQPTSPLGGLFMLVILSLVYGRGLLRKIPFLESPMEKLDRLSAWLGMQFDGIVGVIYDGMYLLVAVLLAQIILATPFLALLASGFGLPPSLFAFFVDVVVEVTPPGRWVVHQMDRPDNAARWMDVSPLELAHSSSYADPRVHALIHTWMVDRLNERTVANSAD